MKPEIEAERIREFLQDKLIEADADGYVLGVSGGVDSATVALLADGVAPVRPLWMPDKRNPTRDRKLAELVAEQMDMPLMARPIGEAAQSLKRPGGTDESLGNIKARLRMIRLYQEANRRNHLVLGTGNKSEILTGYFTKHGDGACDLLPIGHLYKTEVYELAEYMSVPDPILERPPSAGLWKGQTDEDELGMNYEKLDKALKAISASEKTDPDVDLSQDEFKRVFEMMKDAKHKRNTPPTLERR